MYAVLSVLETVREHNEQARSTRRQCGRRAAAPRHTTDARARNCDPEQSSSVS